jgi:hypothetical protein
VNFRLFISHSSPTEDSRQRLRELVAEIEAQSPPAPIRVLVDMEQIVGADDWHQRIAFMLHVCHGGVVLVDGAALSSKWVLAEATFMSLRQRAGDSFAFVPVSFLDEPDLEEEKRQLARQAEFLSDTAWDVVAMPDVQYVRARTPAEVAAQIVSALRARGSLQRMGSPADSLADQLAPKLAEAGSQALRDLADQLADASTYVTGDARQLAALAIVRHMLASGRLTETLRQLDQLGTAFPDQRRREILDELKPLPLPAEAAAMLTRRRASGGYSHASLRTEVPAFTVPLYVRRAHLASRPPRYFAINNTLGSFEDLRANVRQEWRRRFSRPLSDVQVDERLNAPGLDLYVWVPGPVDADVIAQLEQAYPRIAFIIHYAQGSEPAALPPGVLPITPPLPAAEEAAISDDYDDATASLADEGAP